MTTDKPVMYRPICGCETCRRTRMPWRATPVKRRYRPCETRIIVAEMTLAGASKPQIAEVLGITTSGVKYVRRVIADAVRPIRSTHRRNTKVTAAADKIIAMLSAGESITAVSNAVGFDIRLTVWRARSGRSTRPVDLAIAEAAGPAMGPHERTTHWREKRLQATRAAGTSAC